MDSNRWAAIHRGKVPAAKLDALSDYAFSDAFDARERAALEFATEVAWRSTSARPGYAGRPRRCIKCQTSESQ